MKNGIFELQRKNVKTYHTQNPSFYVIVLQIHQSSKSTSAMTSSSVPSPLPLRFFIHRATQRRNFISLSRIFRCDLQGDLCTFTSLSTSCNDISGILDGDLLCCVVSGYFLDGCCSVHCQLQGKQAYTVVFDGQTIERIPM